MAKNRKRPLSVAEVNAEAECIGDLDYDDNMDVDEPFEDSGSSFNPSSTEEDYISNSDENEDMNLDNDKQRDMTNKEIMTNNDIMTINI